MHSFFRNSASPSDFEPPGAICDEPSNSTSDRDVGSVVAVATISRKIQNEDAGWPVLLDAGSGLVICDGVGSSASCARAAAYVAKLLSQDIANADSEAISGQFLRESLKKTQRVLVELETDLNIEEALRSNCLATTVIAVIERTNDYLVGYVGNGSVHVIPGDFLEFVRRDRWPWGTTQMLVPQTSLSEGGTEMLDAVFSPRSRVDSIRISTIEKDRNLGELLVATTDGVFSPDHQRSGRDLDGRLWLQVDPHFESLLFKSLAELPEICKQRGLAARSALSTLLQQFLAQGSWDDDATIGVLISRVARAKLTAGRGDK